MFKYPLRLIVHVGVHILRCDQTAGAGHHRRIVGKIDIFAVDLRHRTAVHDPLHHFGIRDKKPGRVLNPLHDAAELVGKGAALVEIQPAYLDAQFARYPPPLDEPAISQLQLGPIGHHHVERLLGGHGVARAHAHAQPRNILGWHLHPKHWLAGGRSEPEDARPLQAKPVPDRKHHANQEMVFAFGFLGRVRYLRIPKSRRLVAGHFLVVAGVHQLPAFHASGLQSDIGLLHQ